MADYYVATTGSGTGVGSKADPFTLSQAITKADYSVNDNIYILKGTYSVSSQLVHADNFVHLIGYSSTEGDLDDVWGDHADKPLIQASNGASIASIINENAKYCLWYNCVFDGNQSNTGFTGTCVIGEEYTEHYNCVFKNGKTYGLQNGNVVCCVFDSNVTDGVYRPASAYGCLSKNNGGHGYNGAGITNVSISNCVAYNNTGCGFYLDGSWEGICSNNTATGNGSDGFFLEIITAINCIAEDNGGYGYEGGSASYIYLTVNCNSWNNTSGDTHNPGKHIGLNTDDPALFDPSSDDYSLGNSNLYGLGAYIGNLDGSGTLDLGAVQKASGVGPTASPPTFGGITGLERVSPCELKASWSAATGTTTGYKIFVRVGSAPTFTDDYLWGIVDNNRTSVIINTEEDNDTFLDGSDAVYVGVRAYNDGEVGDEDSNTTTLNVTPQGGKVPFSSPDTVIGI